MRRWLARGNWQGVEDPQSDLACVAHYLDVSCPAEGQAALRMWGQTGERPAVWIAGADPVYLEPRLDHLCLHALPADNMPANDLRALLDHLQDKLADDDRHVFAPIGSCGYLRAREPLCTASLPAEAIDRRRPDDHLPEGPEAASYHALRSEVEMALHDHPVNQRRERAGLAPANSLWVWGGGFAPEQGKTDMPPLFADDPSLRGYWHSREGDVADWPGSATACLEAAGPGFVAQPGALADPRAVGELLSELRERQREGRIGNVTLLVAGRHAITVKRRDSWKIWRRSKAMPEAWR